uniref:Uncharacterized protein n=1 Tax=Brassica campestris TaxID=3711 RepID=M4EPG5_BRACM
MENGVNMFGKSESSRSALTRLQRQAPTSLNLVCVPQNHFLQQSCDAVETTAIPLLPSLFVSPNLHSSSPPRQEDNIRFHVGFTEKNGSQRTTRKAGNILPRPNIATKLLS